MLKFTYALYVLGIACSTFQVLFILPQRPYVLSSYASHYSDELLKPRQTKQFSKVV